MKFKEYLDKLNKLAKDNPELSNKDVVYSCDDEGNSYMYVEFDPSFGFYEENYYDGTTTISSANSVCIN